MKPTSTDPRLDLSVCEREPIHIPGSIQPHGVLLALSEGDARITHASANASRVTSTQRPPVGATLSDALPAPAFETIDKGLSALELDSHPRAVGTAASPSGQRYDVLAHRHANSLLLEFEPAPPPELNADGVADRVSAEAARLEQAESVDQLCAAAAAAVRRLTGFDKVMVYRFDDDWNGVVLAEEQGPPDMEAYLGLRFPASDIPPQARELYRLSPIRLIADVDYQPAPILAHPDSAATPLDLSFSVLRSVSPVHLEYLRNMRVAASMSVSIVRGGELWGLIACHHQSPRFIPHPIRSACTILARLIAQLISGIEARREADYGAGVRTMQARVLQNLTDHRHVAEVLADCGDDLLRMADADGAAICVDGACHLLGVTPPPDDVSRLAEWLSSAEGPLFHTDWLPGEYECAERFKDKAAGMLAIALSSLHRNCVMWFRPELVQTVRWAGDPNKPVDLPPGELRLHPRKSFEVWKQNVGRKSRPWRRPEIDAAASLREGLVDSMLRRAEESAARAKDQFLAVLSHELRTPLSPVLTAASALETDPSLSDDARELMRVIRRNVELETRLIDDLLDLTRISKGKLVINPETVDVHTVFDQTLEICERDLHDKGIQLTVARDAVRHHVEADPARLQQVLWNILKNAIKFTPPGGAITIRTRNEARSHVLIELTDTGAGIEPHLLPSIFNAFEQGGRTVTSRYGGLGLGLAIARTLVEIHRGRITAASQGKGQGSTFTIDLPTIPAPAPAPRPAATATTNAPGEHGAKVRILLVEDHKDTARVMTRLLKQLNFDIQHADSIAAARKLVDNHPFDLIISDLGLPDGSGNDLMRELRDRYGLRGIALTGWGMEEDLKATKAAGFDRHLTKPVNFPSLKAAIREVTAGSTPTAP